MLTGLRILTYDGSKITKISSEVDSIDTIKNMDSDTKKLLYLSDSGAAKTGTTTISLMVPHIPSALSLMVLQEVSAKPVSQTDISI